ncbi:MAG: hypothetical protein SWX82_00390 [Cyanobacteriota bacterium]|nr:hypothetical protein [Cyanobacteriota bacterium]
MRSIRQGGLGRSLEASVRRSLFPHLRQKKSALARVLDAESK